MNAKWSNKHYTFNRQIICKRVNKFKSLKNFALKSIEFYQIESIFHSMLEFPPNIPEYETRELLSTAFKTILKTGSFSDIKLLSELNKLISLRNNIPSTRFALLTSISISNSVNMDRLYFGRNIVIFEKNLPMTFRTEFLGMIPKTYTYYNFDPPTNYMYVRIHVTSKSIHEASSISLDTIDFIRGIWNFVINRRRIYNPSSIPKKKPVNKIIAGPIHTLHFPTGKLYTDSIWWSEPNYIEPITPYKPSNKDILNLYESLSNIRQRLKFHAYPDIIKKSLIRYTRALDDRYWSTSFIKLWSILELLTDTVGKDYKMLRKRIGFLFEDSDYHKQVLLHLHKYRNSTVHHDIDNSDVETNLYQLRYYVETLLGFHIYSDYKFSSIYDACSFLNLPCDKDTISKRIKNLNNVLKFRQLS